MSLYTAVDTVPEILSLKPIAGEMLLPNFSKEQHLLDQGGRTICGVDEVGRGPLAGPVVTAAVILDQNNIPSGLQDSKKLSVKTRLKLAEEIYSKALSVSFASLPAKEIDNTNIRYAALKAMSMAVNGLAIKPDYALIDGRDIPPQLGCRAFPLIKGDSRSVSIAAASIIAKIMRDKMLDKLGAHFPAYGFSKHAGYGTKQHKQAIEEKGAIENIHRFSFAPMKYMHKV